MPAGRPKDRKLSGIFGIALGDSVKHRGDDLEAKRAALLVHWSKHPWNWLLGEDLVEREVSIGIRSRKLIWTTDERDDEHPIKPFPRREYLRRFVHILHTENEVLLDKARQMMATTLTLLYIDWTCRFRPARRWIISKNKEQEAYDLLRDKIRAVHYRLPTWVQDRLPVLPEPQGKVIYDGTGSYILGAPENVADSEARGGTATGFLIDEAARQRSFSSIWSAAAPMSQKLFAITTAKLGGSGAIAFLKMLERDQREEETAAS